MSAPTTVPVSPSADQAWLDASIAEVKRLAAENERLTLILNHDIDAPSAKALGEKSPIVDVEHYYLYSKATLSKLAEAHGFEVVESGSVWNDYSAGYVARLLPLPKAVKQGLQGALQATRLARPRVKVPLGNLYVVVRRK